ncbi:hypothetical protein Acor_09910 [Acrocarpospora corrugata]|uniref:Uncharacterized protein n=1 Tax=Acrocarpospora corrugata TaxID=35763 RepID=A0A5M3VWZ9_9ACTN|nr:hypothetical protein [Acrocarpospora corrugata]GER98927.1 hypothetical protein Acor_09910 [Acrocarpospora corrugata]
MPGPRTFDATALLDLLERSWAWQLRRVSLVIEAGLAGETIDAAADALGEACRRVGHRELATRWPACVAGCVAGVAARHGAADAFWPRWWAASRHRGSPARWGTAFLDALRVLGLPADPDVKRSIMMHAGHGTAPEVPSPLDLDPFGAGVRRGGTALTHPGEETLLVFGEDGRHLPGELPEAAVWVAHPGDRDLIADIPIRIIAESFLPSGWDGWRLTQISLANAAWLALADGPRHPVRGRVRPRLLIEEPTPGLAGPGGSPVLAAPPALRLPAGTWLATVQPAGARPAPADPADLWARLPRPLLGTFTVDVRDARGRGTRETVTLAEGLSARYDPPVRLFDDGGPTPVDALFGTVPGLTVAPQALAFTRTEITRGITCVAGDRVLALTVTPPHMRVLAGREWHTAPLRLTPEELGSLRLEIPGVRERPPIEVRAGGVLVQELTPHANGEYPLRRVLDTVAAHGQALLAVRRHGRLIPLAVISPAVPAAPDPWLCND